ncbi:MAG TPA: helix-turn-helix domain-containing protein, partial [Gammaproteobacteria bacterium]|nr:helix-turn-helix domain-containing protein [Gammaproteobacteria bacterium]
MKCKRQFDGRKLNRQALEALRVRAVQRMLDGESPEVLAKTLDMNPATLYKWMARYHYGGMDALKVKRQTG